MRIFELVTATVVAASVGAGAAPTRDKQEASPFNFPEYKYFHESSSDIHYDGRFMKQHLNEEHQKAALKVLVQTYLATFRSIGVETWLMHGSLLGWWWGKKIMPWDFDADVQVAEADMFFLAAYYNMTTYYFENDDIPDGKLFLLEINPHFKHRETDDALNVIDARWIDTSTGLFIDITAARYSLDHKEGEGILYDKNEHEYRDTYLYPLHETTFEGVPVKIPFSYKEMLASEYTEKALTNKFFKDHIYDDNQKQWILAAQPDW